MQALILVGFLAVFAIQDIRSGKISVLLAAAAAAVGILLYILFPFRIESLLGGLIAGGILLAAAFLSRGRIGPGDGLLLLICGLFLGMRNCLAVLIIASFFAAGAAALMLIGKKAEKNSSFPFAPCLFAAAVLQNVLQTAAR